jgi:hypothetical protein
MHDKERVFYDPIFKKEEKNDNKIVNMSQVALSCRNWKHKTWKYVVWINCDDAHDNFITSLFSLYGLFQEKKKSRGVKKTIEFNAHTPPPLSWVSSCVCMCMWVC